MSFGDLFVNYQSAPGSPRATLFRLQINQSRQLVTLYKIYLDITVTNILFALRNFIAFLLSTRDERLVHF